MQVGAYVPQRMPNYAASLRSQRAVHEVSGDDDRRADRECEHTEHPAGSNDDERQPRDEKHIAHCYTHDVELRLVLAAVVVEIATEVITHICMMRFSLGGDTGQRVTSLSRHSGRDGRLVL